MKQAFVSQKVAANTRAQRPQIRPQARQLIVCAAQKDTSNSRILNGVSHAVGALAAVQMVFGAAAAPALAEVSFDSSKLGAPAQNKDAVDLPSTFFKTGDQLQEKLGIDTDPRDLGDKLKSGAKSFNAPSQADGQLDDVAKATGNATQKAAQNITPDLSELPNPSDLPNPFDDTGFADKAKGIVKDAVSNIPDPSEAADKAKGLGKELGRNVPDPSAAADKAKGTAKGLANDLPNPADAVKNKRI